MNINLKEKLNKKKILIRTAKMLSCVVLSLIILSFLNMANAQTPVGSLPGINPVESGYIDSCSINPNIKGGLTLKYIIMNLIIGCILTRTAYLIIAAAFVVFLYGIFKFISAEGDDKQGGRELMFWGIIGIFVMISFWGLVAILQNTFKF